MIHASGGQIRSPARVRVRRVGCSPSKGGEGLPLASVCRRGVEGHVGEQPDASGAKVGNGTRKPVLKPGRLQSLASVVHREVYGTDGRLLSDYRSPGSRPGRWHR